MLTAETDGSKVRQHSVDRTDGYQQYGLAEERLRPGPR